MPLLSWVVIIASYLCIGVMLTSEVLRDVAKDVAKDGVRVIGRPFSKRALGVAFLICSLSWPLIVICNMLFGDDE